MDSVKVAIASTDGKRIDTHFGQATEYIIYKLDLDNSSYEKIGVKTLEIPELSEEQSCGCFGKNDVKLEAIGKQLQDFDYLLVEKIGPKPQKFMMRYQINCLETDYLIQDALEQLIEYLKK